MSNITSIEASVQKSVTHYALHFSTLTQTQKGHVRCHFLANALEWLATGSKREALQVDPDNTLSFICLNDRSSLCGKVAKWALSFFEPLIRTIFWSFNREFANNLQQAFLTSSAQTPAQNGELGAHVSPLTTNASLLATSPKATFNENAAQGLEARASREPTEEQVFSLKERVEASGIDAFSVQEILEFTPPELAIIAPPLMEKGLVYDVLNNEQCIRAAAFLKKCAMRNKKTCSFEKNTNAKIKQALDNWIANDQLPKDALEIFSQRFAEMKQIGIKNLIIERGIQYFTLEEINKFSLVGLQNALIGLDVRRQQNGTQYFATGEFLQIATLIEKCVGTKAMDSIDEYGESIAIQIIDEFRNRINEIEKKSPQAQQIFNAAFQKWLEQQSR